MRTTLTLDDQLAKSLQEYACQNRQSFKEVVNQSLAAGLSIMERPTQIDTCLDGPTAYRK